MSQFPLICCSKHLIVTRINEITRLGKPMEYYSGFIIGVTTEFDVHADHLLDVLADYFVTMKRNE